MTCIQGFCLFYVGFLEFFVDNYFGLDKWAAQRMNLSNSCRKLIHNVVINNFDVKMTHGMNCCCIVN
jgi:hypothetical protein